MYGRESLDRITSSWQVESALILAVSILSSLYSHIWVLLLRRMGGKLLVIAAVGAIFALVVSAGLAFATGTRPSLEHLHPPNLANLFMYISIQ